MSDLVLSVPAPFHPSSQADNDTQLVDLWLHGRTENTRLAYERDLHMFFQVVNKNIQEVRLGDVQQFVDALQCAVASKRRIIATIKSLFSFAQRVGYVRYNVAAAVRPPKAMNTLAERILPEASIHRMIALTPEGRDRMLLRTLYATGARVSELCAMKWRHLQANGESGQVTVLGKGGKTRAILLPVNLWNDLMDFRADAIGDVPVFPSRKLGGHLDPVQVLRIVRQAARRAGIKGNVSPHWYRHAHASHSLDRGAGIHVVCVTLGHSTLAVTSTYVHAKPTESSAKFLAV